MLDSPSMARSLPSLRPSQVSPLAASRGGPTTFQASKPPPSSIQAQTSRSSDEASTQSSFKPTSTRVQSSVELQKDCFQLPTPTKRKEVSTIDGLDPSRPKKAARVHSRSLQDESRPLRPSRSLSHAPFKSASTTSQPFFSLTTQELKTLRRSMGKGSGYTQFRDITIARTLDRLGRGWGGYLKAKDRAEQEGKIDGFWHHFGLELKTVLSATNFLPGAISIETAAIAAQSNYTASVGRLRLDNVEEIRWLRTKSWPDLANPDMAGHNPDPFDSTTSQLPSSSPSIPEADSKVRTQGSPDPVPDSRPKRNMKRPDYRIPPIFESSPEPPSSLEPPSSPDNSSKIASPTPREIYDRTQPKFVQYPCDWNGCKASLKNLETLQRHIRIVHAEEARDTLCCRWGTCGTGTPRMYESAEGLDHHFETSHLKQLQWRLGDG